MIQHRTWWSDHWRPAIWRAQHCDAHTDAGLPVWHRASGEMQGARRDAGALRMSRDCCRFSRGSTTSGTATRPGCSPPAYRSMSSRPGSVTSRSRRPSTSTATCCQMHSWPPLRRPRRRSPSPRFSRPACPSSRRHHPDGKPPGWCLSCYLPSPRILGRQIPIPMPSRTSTQGRLVVAAAVGDGRMVTVLVGGRGGATVAVVVVVTGGRVVSSTTSTVVVGAGALGVGVPLVAGVLPVRVSVAPGAVGGVGRGDTAVFVVVAVAVRVVVMLAFGPAGGSPEGAGSSPGLTSQTAVPATAAATVAAPISRACLLSQPSNATIPAPARPPLMTRSTGRRRGSCSA